MQYKKLSPSTCAGGDKLLFCYFSPVSEYESNGLVLMDNTVINHNHPKFTTPFGKDERLLPDGLDMVEKTVPTVLFFC